ncbi:MAG: hypothetical protein AAFW73_08310 [Bacteroidota bacterium]
MLDGRDVQALDPAINALGKSLRGEVFAIRRGNRIRTTRGWEGETIAEFALTATTTLGIKQLLPFNDGKQVLATTAEGIFGVDQRGERRIHPQPDPDEEDWEPFLAMENAALSPDNAWVVIGDSASSPATAASSSPILVTSTMALASGWIRKNFRELPSSPTMKVGTSSPSTSR